MNNFSFTTPAPFSKGDLEIRSLPILVRQVVEANKSQLENGKWMTNLHFPFSYLCVNLPATGNSYTGPDFQQEPGLTDIRAVRNNPDLKTDVYEGEYVITNDKIYKIDKMGDVSEVGNTEEVFREI